ncbi:structural maintenance of chromosomes protein 5-like [Ischnura elegans]|uniref:structural maintenance of chromosomes protein 5-like n=1 Tax=Ischnura elegans TaxID=197161 RepID=UPI001ED87D8F|nr:structural maintenance of chromosomes protein 5-like [Ischnura elegans]
MDGSIVRLYLRDFMTFHEITLLTKNHLNLITGPNGSGKSSIMCALCLGLSGKPKVVGRAYSVSKYIRYNADRATIEIELYNTKGKNYVVSRTIFRGNKSSWSIGGYSCSQEEVENLTSKLNIQIDNLCQSLPQGSVQDFAKMNSLTLMENTEKCIGGMAMLEKHLQLKKLGAAYLENEKILHSKMEYLSNEEQIFAGLQSAMDKMTTKKALVSKVKVLKQKRAHLVYEAANNDLKMAEEMLKEKTASVNKIVEEIKPMKAAIGYAKRQLKAYEDKIKSANSQCKKHHQSIDGVFKSLKRVRAKCKDFERMLADENRRVEPIKDLQLQIEFMANLLGRMNEQELREKEAKLAAEEKQVTREIYAQQIEKLSIDNKILSIECRIWREEKISNRPSRYTKEASSSSYLIGDAHCLRGSVNESSIRESAARLSQLEEELLEWKNVFSGHEYLMEKLEDVLSGVRHRRSENKAQLNKAIATKSQLLMLKRREEEARAMECRKEDLRRNLFDAIRTKSTLVRKILWKLKGFENLIEMIKLVQLNVHKARNDVSVIEHDLSESTKKLEEAEKEERACREIFEAAKNQTRNHLKQLEELCKSTRGRRLRHQRKVFQNLLKKFSEYPDTLEEIDQEIHVTQTKAELIGHLDSNVEIEFYRRKKTIEGIKKVLDRMNADKKKLLEEIEALKSCWLPFVNDLIKRLVKTFGSLLSIINYVGEVILVQGENEFDFGNYGFKIQVKFQQEGGLQELNRFRLSGGERAVAIAVYLLSLQELTSVPFRCVDEINQGMDEYHEASVFRLLSEIASKDGAAQYIILSSKVPRTLTFSDSLLYTCVINGEVDNITVDCDEIAKIKKAKRMKLGSE